MRWFTILPSHTDTPITGKDIKAKLQTLIVHKPERACPARIKMFVQKK